jgi:hypothetical protein
MKKIFQLLVLIFVFSNVLNAQSPKEIECSGHYWTFTNPIPLNSKLDSTTIINSILKECERNPNNKIASSSEVFKLLESKYEFESPKLQVPCKKHYFCKESFGLDAFENINIFKNYSDEETKKMESDFDYVKELTIYIYARLLSGENNVHFKHPCKKCANWSDAYRKKVGCNVCFDEKSTYCGAKVTCPMCNGTGFRWEEQDPLELTFSEYLQKIKINNPQFIGYFNSPLDFGFINCERKIKINCVESQDLKLISGNDFVFLTEKEANNIRQQVIDFKNEKERKLQNDREITVSIQLNLNNNNPVKAAYNYQNLYFPNDKLKNTIELELNELYKDSIYYVDISLAKKIVANNSFAILNSNLKKIDILFDLNANIIYSSNIKLSNSNIKVKHLNIYNFQIPVKQKISIEIVEDVKLVPNSDIIVADTRRSLLKMPNGKIYKSSFLGTSWFNENHKTQSYLNSNEIHHRFSEINEVPKRNHYLIISKRVRTFHANIDSESSPNNIIKLGEKEEAYISSEGKFSKRIVKKSFRLSTLLVALPWTLLRFYEFLIVQ